MLPPVDGPTYEIILVSLAARYHFKTGAGIVNQLLLGLVGWNSSSLYRILTGFSPTI